MKKLIPGVIAGVAIVVIAIALLSSQTSSPTAEDKVAATIFPLYDITQNIAGETVDVELVLPAGTSPHTFDPTPSTLRDLQGTVAIYAIGHELDGWTDTLTDSVGAETVVVDAGIEIRESAHADEHEDEHDEDPDEDHHDEEEHDDDHDDHEDEEEHEDEDDHDGHAHGATDPHYFLSISNANTIAQTIADDLSQRFPEHAETFNANLEDYLAELGLAQNEIIATLDGVENNNLITLHDAWYYFAEEYDLNVVGTFEPSPGREPTPQYLIELTEAVESARVNTIYSEPQLATDSIDAFVSDNGLTIAELDPIGGVEGRMSYIDLMKYNAEVIAQNQ